MGKLHTLRRAIERNPEEFMRVYGDDQKAEIYGAGFYNGKWQRTHVFCGRSYKGFVTRVLLDMKIIRVGSRNRNWLFVSRDEELGT